MQYYAFDDSCQALVGNFFCEATGQLIPARCKKWSCKFCGPRRARRWIARIRRAARVDYFLTLTAPPHGAVTRALVKKFNASWRSFLQWLKREIKGIGDISWTLEQGKKTGHLHRHVLIQTGRSFSYKRARAALVRSGHGAVCKFIPVRSSQSARVGSGYLGKYLGKMLDEHSTQWPRYSRRAQTTVPELRSESPFEYKFISKPGVIWRRRGESHDPVIDYVGGKEEYVGGQRELTLNQIEKLRQAEWKEQRYVSEKSSP
jgi:hypothetical protein